MNNMMSNPELQQQINSRLVKGDIPTPPGTGHIGSLTEDQKQILKDVWATIFYIADSGEAIVPADLMNEVQKEATSGNAAKSATVQAAAKAGWFSGNKAAKAQEEAKAAGFGSDMAKISLADLGLSVDKLRPILWDNVMGDHPGRATLSFVLTGSIFREPISILTATTTYQMLLFCGSSAPGNGTWSTRST